MGRATKTTVVNKPREYRITRVIDEANLGKLVRDKPTLRMIAIANAIEPGEAVLFLNKGYTNYGVLWNVIHPNGKQTVLKTVKCELDNSSDRTKLASVIAGLETEVANAATASMAMFIEAIIGKIQFLMDHGRVYRCVRGAESGCTTSTQGTNQGGGKRQPTASSAAASSRTQSWRITGSGTFSIKP